MRNFLQIGSIDPVPTLAALLRDASLWNENTLRTKHPGTAHAEADDIWLMFNSLSDDVANDIQVQPYRAWGELSSLRGQVLDLMRRVDGVQLGRVIISRLKPGGRILPHVDEGAPATFYSCLLYTSDAADE